MVVNAGIMVISYPKIEAYEKELERLQGEHPHLYRNGMGVIRLVKDVGLEEELDFYCGSAIAEAEKKEGSILTWTAFLIPHLQKHEGLFKCRNIMINLL